MQELVVAQRTPQRPAKAREPDVPVLAFAPGALDAHSAQEQAEHNAQLGFDCILGHQPLVERRPMRRRKHGMSVEHWYQGADDQLKIVIFKVRPA